MFLDFLVTCFLIACCASLMYLLVCVCITENQTYVTNTQPRYQYPFFPMFMCRTPTHRTVHTTTTTTSTFPSSTSSTSFTSPSIRSSQTSFGRTSRR